MNKYLEHQNLLNDTTIHLQKCFPGARFFDRHVGKFYSPRIMLSLIEFLEKNISFSGFELLKRFKSWLIKSKSKYIISINKPGMSDKYGIIPVSINGKKVPVHIELEFKSGSSRLSSAQKIWRDFCDKSGILFIEARNKHEVEFEIRQYVKYLEDGGALQ